MNFSRRWSLKMLALCALSCGLSAAVTYTEDMLDTGYVPSKYVKMAAEMSTSPVEFNIDYGKSLAITVGVPFVVGLLALVLFASFILFRCCCECIRCRPKHPYALLLSEDEEEFDHHDDYEEHKTYPWRCNKITTYVFFFLAILGIVGVSQVMLFARPQILTGVRTVHGTAISIFDTIHNVTEESYSIFTDSLVMGNELTAAKSSCPQLSFASSQIDSNLAKFQDVSTTMKNLTQDVDYSPTPVDAVYANAHVAGNVFYVLYGVPLAIALLFSCFTFFSIRECMRATIAVSTCVYLVWIVLSLIFFALTIFLGDFCEAPAYNVVRLAPSGYREDLAYYLTCNDQLFSSSLPIQKNLNKAYGYVSQFISQIDTASSTICVNDANLAAMKSTVLQVNASLNIVEDQISCEHLQSFWSGFVETAVCTESFQGLFMLWYTMVSVSVLLMLAMIIASCVYQFHLPENEWKGFSKDWKAVEGDEDEEEARPRSNRNAGQSNDRANESRHSSHQNSRQSSRQSSRRQAQEPANDQLYDRAVPVNPDHVELVPTQVYSLGANDNHPYAYEQEYHDDVPPQPQRQYYNDARYQQSLEQRNPSVYGEVQRLPTLDDDEDHQIHRKNVHYSNLY